MTKSIFTKWGEDFIKIKAEERKQFLEKEMLWAKNVTKAEIAQREIDNATPETLNDELRKSGVIK